MYDRSDNLTKRDIILLAFVSLVDGRAGAKLIFSFARKYLKKYLSDRSVHDFDAEHFYNMLSRLRRDGLIARSGKLWHVTERGMKKISLLRKYEVYKEFRERYRSKTPNTIVIFDVPEINRKKRDYLRIELGSLGYVQLQKSVWFGHSPLPKEFLDYIQEMRLSRCIHIFSVGEYGSLR